MWVFQISLNTLCWKQVNWICTWTSLCFSHQAVVRLISTTSKAHQDTQIVDIDLQKHNDWSETGKCTCTLLLDFRKYPMHREHISILCKPIHGKHVRSTDLAFYTSTPSDLDDCWTHICIACLFTCSWDQTKSTWFHSSWFLLWSPCLF